MCVRLGGEKEGCFWNVVSGGNFVIVRVCEYVLVICCWGKKCVYGIDCGVRKCFI